MSNHGRGECACCERKYAALRIAGTIDGVHMRQRDAYRDILLDLIAELRQLEGLPCTCTETVLCVKHSVFRWADRAEARLKGLNDE